MKRYCFAQVIMLYTLWLVGCGRQENTLLEENAFDPTISLSMAEKLDILEEDDPVSSVPRKILKMNK